MKKRILLSVIILLIISSCITHVNTNKPLKMRLLPGIKVPVVLFDKYVNPVDHRRADPHELYRGCEIQDNDIKLFLPSTEEIILAEHIVLHHLQKSFPDVYMHPVDYKKSFFGKSGRQYIGMLCEGNKVIRINYLRWIGHRKTRKLYGDMNCWRDAFINSINIDSYNEKLSPYSCMDVHIVNITDSTLVR